MKCIVEASLFVKKILTKRKSYQLLLKKRVVVGVEPGTLTSKAYNKQLLQWGYQTHTSTLSRYLSSVCFNGITGNGGTKDWFAYICPGLYISAMASGRRGACTLEPSGRVKVDILDLGTLKARNLDCRKWMIYYTHNRLVILSL